MPEAHIVLTTKQATALSRIKQQESNLVPTKATRIQLYSDQAADLDLTPVQPERKPVFVPTEDHRPYLKAGKFVPYLKIGKFVKIKAKTDTGFSSPRRYSYVSESFGVNTAVFYEIKYTPAYDRVYKQVNSPCSPVNECLTKKDIGNQ